MHSTKYCCLVLPIMKIFGYDILITFLNLKSNLIFFKKNSNGKLCRKSNCFRLNIIFTGLLLCVRFRCFWINVVLQLTDPQLAWMEIPNTCTLKLKLKLKLK